MDKDLIFFSAEGKGLTSTSANHVANMAKEMIRTLEARLAAMVFYSTEVSLIGSGSVNVLRNGADADDVKNLSAIMHRVTEAKSLIAWLREAIKAKDRLMRRTEDLSLEEFAKLEGIKIPEVPVMESALTEDEYYGSLSLEERNRYYELETLAAVIGKEIHPGGHFADARDDLARRTQNPRSVEGDGRDTLIYSYEPSVDAGLIESVYFHLQKQYREAQAKLNSMKYECEKAVTDSKVKVRTDYTNALEKWNGEMQAIRSRHAEYIRKKVREYGGLKILIPDTLDNIYQEVSRLGKNRITDEQKVDHPIRGHYL